MVQTKKALTEEQKAWYLKHSGSCPYCRSNNIEGYAGYDAEGDTIATRISCLSCHREWRDIYTLNDIMED